MRQKGGCINCEMLEDSINTFNQRNTHAYGSPYYTKLLENYLNKAYGLNLIYSDYIGFMKNCAVAKTGQDTITVCTTKTAQADSLAKFIKKLFDNTRPHTYKNTFALISGPDSTIFPTNLYFSNRNKCKLYYKPISIFKNKLSAKLFDSCGFSCLLTLSLPDSSKHLDRLLMCSLCTIYADAPSLDGGNYNFVIPCTYNGSSINLKGSTTCYPIKSCSPVPQTLCISYPNINKTLSVHSIDTTVTNMDTCGCKKLGLAYNYLLKLRHIPRDSINLHPEYMDTACQVLYGIHYPNAFTNFGGTCLNTIGSIMVTNHDTIGRNIDTLKMNYTNWGTSWTPSLLNVLHSVPVRQFLTCATCQNCSQYESAVNTFNQTAASTKSKRGYYSRLQTYLQNTLNFPVKALPVPMGGCMACGDTSVMVCDSINQTALDLGGFLKRLAINNKLYSTRVKVDSAHYYYSFLKTTLDQYTNADSILYGGKFVSDTLYDTISYYRGAGHALQGRCTLKMGQYTTSGIDSFTRISLDPKKRGSNYNFRIVAWHHSGMTVTKDTLQGISTCYSLGNCCYIDNRKLCRKNHDITPKDTNDCLTKLTQIATELGKHDYQIYIDSVRKGFRQRYVNKCMKSVQENLTVRYKYNTFHFTLYYYNQAGNLVKTVMPGGVKPIVRRTAWDSIERMRPNPNAPLVLPAHTLITNTQYNTLGNPYLKTTPDAGTVQTWYDRLGRHALTQDANQTSVHKFSYTKYDPLNRVIEVGELQNSNITVLNHDSFRVDSKLQAFINAGVRGQIINTYYDEPMNGSIPLAAFGTSGQQNLRSRVASKTYRDRDTTTYNYATHFSYDEHGNVQTLVQDFPELSLLGYEYFKVQYDYDLISNKVNYVSYQKGKSDQFYHKYIYDADNRITDVFTSRDSVIWDEDADYLYYLHGPLARLELGEYQVQGLDYAYTVQGWLKGVNSGTLNQGRDMGKDGWQPGSHKDFARDAFGFTISYFNGDFQAIGSGSFEAKVTGSGLDALAPGLFNGNIRHIVTATTQFGRQAAAYNYDQLNRLRSVDINRGIDTINNKWLTGGNVKDYHESFVYDQNGNITQLVRRGNTVTGLPMDSQTFNYYIGCNRLKRVKDTIASGAYPDDIDNQADSNYKYDANGNLVYNKQDSLLTIDWNVYGKIKSIVRTNGCSKANLSFRYNPDQYRVRKLVKPKGYLNNWDYTYYVRDAQGNILGVYDKKLKNLHVLNPGSCTRILPLLRDTIIGLSNYINFFANNFATNTVFVNDLDILVQADGAFVSWLLNQYPPSFYAMHDPPVEDSILNHYSANTIVNYLLNCSGKTVILNYIQSIAPPNSLYTAEMTTNCNAYLTQMNAIDPTMIPALYAFFFPGCPPLPLAGMINVLCGNPPPCPAPNPTIAAIINQINIFNPTANSLTWQSMPNAQIMADIAFVWPGGIPISKAQFKLLYSPYDIIHCIETQDAGLESWLISNYSNIALLHDIELFDAAGFINASLSHNNMWAQQVICTIMGYNMFSFLEIIRTAPMLGQPIVDQVWLHLNGTPGGIEEKFNLTELDIYGAKRLGVLNVDTTLVKRDYNGHVQGDEVIADTLYPPVINLVYDTIVFRRILGKKSYELFDRNENILATVSDRKIAIDSAGTGTTIAYYNADCRSAIQYYGYLSPAKIWEAAKYRYSVNGQEREDEISGKGNTTVALNWEYDTRLPDGRWNRETIPKAYISDYAVFDCNPILKTDPNGDNPLIPIVLALLYALTPEPLNAPTMDKAANKAAMTQALHARDNYLLTVTDALAVVKFLPKPKLQNAAPQNVPPNPKQQGTYSNPQTQRPLPRNNNGEPVPDPEAQGSAHTQLGTKPSRTGSNYNQAREFDAQGKPKKDIDFTDHGRPKQHSNPHQHSYTPNPSGGTLQRGSAQPVNPTH
jgi:hypothetical protein